MADRSQAVAENSAGDFFVDHTCIDCDTCRQVAPSVFADAGDHSYVRRQPTTEVERREALRAVLCCPTNSIGSRESAKEAVPDFPLAIEDNVYYCGFNSEKSFGGNSYFIRHSGGNWLIDAPRWLPHLVKRFEELAGIAYVFFTHQDDIADGDRYAERFGAKRIVHEADRRAVPAAEIVLVGEEPRRFADDILAIPTPGHTAGHLALHYRDRFLFTGDHVWWNEECQGLSASRDYCWHSWGRQIESMERLLDYRFEWVLPGHGRRAHLKDGEMRRQMEILISRMRS